MNEEQFLTLPQVRAICGFGTTYIYEAMKSGAFPKCRKIGRASRWLKSEVLKWIAKKNRAGGGGVTDKIKICEACGEQCETVEIEDEYPTGADHVHGGAHWESCEVEVSECCEADFEEKEVDDEASMELDRG